MREGPEGARQGGGGARPEGGAQPGGGDAGGGRHSLSSCASCSARYSPHGAYAQSKLALVLFTYHLQALLAAQRQPVTANVVDPGVVNTELYRHVFWGPCLRAKMPMTWCFFKVSVRSLVCVLGASAGSPGRRFPCSVRRREGDGLVTSGLGAVSMPARGVHALPTFPAKEGAGVGPHRSRAAKQVPATQKH